MSEPFAQSLVPSSSAPTARFERQQAEEFARRSNSEQPRRAYQRVVREFFAAAGNLHPTAIAPTHVCDWRDALLLRRQKAAAVSFKLSVVRAFFGYLKD